MGIGVAVLRPDAVLLVRRGRPPAQGAWSLPGGAQRLGETAEQAARRELMEETGLCVGPLHLAGHVDSISHDADGRVRFHYTILDFCTAYAGGEAIAGGDAVDVAWCGFDQFSDFELWDKAVGIIATSRAILT